MLELEGRFSVYGEVAAEQPLFANGVRMVDAVDRVLAGETLADIAHDFNLDPEEVELAIRIFAAAEGRVAKCKRYLRNLALRGHE